MSLPAAPQRVFLDTSIFVYLFDATATAKQARARELVKQCLTSGTGVVSHQVVQEFAHVALHRMRCPMTTDGCAQVLEELLLPMQRVGFSAELAHTALALREETRYPWYDSLVLAAAVEARCEVFLSEDLQHHQLVRGVRIHNPFLDAVHERPSN